MTRLVHQAVALAASLALGTAAALVVDHRIDASAEQEFVAGDRVMAAVEGLKDDRVHVTDDGRDMLDEAGEAAIAAAIAERDLPVYVVVWEDSWFAGYDHYVQAADGILHQLDEPALLVLWQGPDTSTTEVTPGYRLPPGEDPYDQPEDEPDYLGDPELRIPEWLDQLPDGALVEQEEWDYYGGTVGGFFWGLLQGLPIVLGVWVLIGIVRLRTGRRFRNLPPEAG